MYRIWHWVNEGLLLGLHPSLRLLAHHETLAQFGFSHESIVAIASYGGARKSISAVAEGRWAGKLDTGEVLNLVSRTSGSHALSWYLQHHTALLELEEDKEQILPAATWKGPRRTEYLQERGLIA